MNRKTLILLLFVLVAMLQLFVPAKMILNREDVINTGKEFKFRTEPVDPSDPFRGKYINLRFADNAFEVENEKEWADNETVYVILIADSEGYAKIFSVSKDAPKDTQDYLKAKVSYTTLNGQNKIFIDYPFDRYYMEESKAYKAERVHAKAQSNTNQITYALVSVKDGESVLKDVLIDGKSIREIVKDQLDN